MVEIILSRESFFRLARVVISARLGPLMKPRQFKGLESSLDYKFINHDLIVEALTHSSFRSNNKNARTYERLEFLGDNIVNYAVADLLYTMFPNAKEGELSKYRSYFVSEKLLAKIGAQLQLNKYVLVGKSYKEDHGLIRDSVLADLVESLFAAITLDSNIETAKNILHKYLQEYLFACLEKKPTDHWMNPFNHDYKSDLQELLQKKSLPVPKYKTIGNQYCLDDEKFSMGIYFNEQLLSEGVASSKKLATQLAAKNFVVKFKTEKEMFSFLNTMKEQKHYGVKNI